MQILLAKDPYRQLFNARGFPISLSLKGILEIFSRHVPAVLTHLKDAKEQYVGKFYVLSYRYVCSLAKAMLGNTDPRIEARVLKDTTTRALGGTPVLVAKL